MGNEHDLQAALWQTFAQESAECLEQVEVGLLAVEARDPDPEQINALYRALHTLKGNCNIMGLRTAGSLAHHGEDLVSAARDGGLELDRDRIDVLLAVLDRLRTLIGSAAEQRAEANVAIDDLVERLQALSGGGERSTAPTVEVMLFDEPQAETAPKEAARPVVSTHDHFLRVPATRVRELLDLTAEISLAVGPDRRLQLLVRSLRHIASAMALVPLQQTFDRMLRTIRDVSRETGKDVELVIEGGQTEIDKQIVDRLFEPLIHLVRNSVDHGIEPADRRAAAGKSKTGRVTLSASQRGQEIVILVADDGAGLNRERILRLARERNLIAHNAEPSDEALWQVIFEPGFSTATKVTSVSGRGVGMDVVRSAIEAMHGRIVTHSRAGEGTTFELCLPLTLAFADGMVVTVGPYHYVVPLGAVSTVLHVQESMCSYFADGSSAITVLDELVPIHWLGEPSELPGRVVVVVFATKGLLGIPVDRMLGCEQVTIKPLEGPLARIRVGAGCCLLRSGEAAIALDCEKLRPALQVAGESAETRASLV